MGNQRWGVKLLFSMLGFAGLMLVVPLAGAAEYSISTIDTDRARQLTYKAKIAYEAIGHTATFHFLPPKRSLLEVNSGTFDAELAQVPGIEVLFPNLVMVPEPIFEVSVSAVVRKNSGILSMSWDDLKTHTFASPFQKKLVELRTGGYPGVTVRSSENIIKMVSRGRLDAGILLTVDANFFAALDDSVMVLSPVLGKTLLYHFVHKKNKDLIPALTKAFHEVNRNGPSSGIVF